MKVLEYVVVINERQTKELRDKGISPKAKLLNSSPQLIVAENADKAKLLIAATLPKEYLDNLDLVEIYVQSFLG